MVHFIDNETKWISKANSALFPSVRWMELHSRQHVGEEVMFLLPLTKCRKAS